MSLSTTSSFLRYATLILQEIKYWPSILEAGSIVFYAFANWGSVSVSQFFLSFVQMFSIWIELALYFPVDMWIDYETFGIADALKTTNGNELNFIRIMSFVVNIYSLLVSTGFVAEWIALAFGMPNWTVPSLNTIGEEVTSFIAMSVSVLYFFQVYFYLPY
jgi:hypothetical protein